MTASFLFITFTVNSVVSQLVLQRGLQDLVSPASFTSLPRFIYGETLSLIQWAGIALVTLGVACISLGGIGS
jgi:drug/metabolite transporter (DMT)-like permease